MPLSLRIERRAWGLMGQEGLITIKGHCKHANTPVKTFDVDRERHPRTDLYTIIVIEAWSDFETTMGKLRARKEKDDSMR
jgi:hypothetical protein